MKTTKLLSATILLAVVATTTAIANAEEIPTPTTTVVETEPTPTTTPTPTEIVYDNSYSQLEQDKSVWQNTAYSNPYTEAELEHEPNAADLAAPSVDASSEEWNAWWMGRVANCEILTKDAEYIDCMWRPWVYGF